MPLNWHPINSQKRKTKEMNTIELQQERKPVYIRHQELRTEIANLMKEGKEVPQELTNNFDECEKRYDSLSEQINLSIRADKIELEQASTSQAMPVVHSIDEDRSIATDNVTPENRDAAFHAWVKFQSKEDLTDAEVDNAKRCGVNVRSKDYEVRLNTTLGTGGDTIQDEFSSKWEAAQLAFGSVRNLATIIPTSTGGQFIYPTTNDTSNMGEQLGEQATTATLDLPTSRLILNSYKYSSKLVKISSEWLRDSQFNVSAFLGDALSTRIARITNDRYTTGTGTGQPNGVVTAATVGVTAALSSAITMTEVIDLVDSLDFAYEANASFMMNKSIRTALRKLVDGNGNFLWQDSVQAGVPTTLLGFNVSINEQMTGTFGVNNEIILFGDFSKYLVRDIGSARILHQVDALVSSDEEAFVVFASHDGDLLNAGTNPIVKLKLAAV